jgi:hypothetical protein
MNVTSQDTSMKALIIEDVNYYTYINTIQIDPDIEMERHRGARILSPSFHPNFFF